MIQVGIDHSQYQYYADTLSVNITYLCHLQQNICIRALLKSDPSEQTLYWSHFQKAYFVEF